MKRCKEAGYHIIKVQVGADKVTFILKIIGSIGSCFLYNGIVYDDSSYKYVTVYYHGYMDPYDFYNLCKHCEKKKKIMRDKFIELLLLIRNSTTKSINYLSEFNKILSDEEIQVL